MSPRNYELRSEVQRFSKRVVCFASTLALVLFFSGCAFKKLPNEPEASLRSDSIKTNKIEPEARPLFFQAEKLYFGKNFDQAAPVYNQVRQKFPKGKANQLSSYRLGSIYYYQGNYVAAEREFQGFLARHPQTELTFDVTYNLAATLYQLGRNTEAYQTISRLKLNDIQNQGPKRAETVYVLTGQIASAMGNPSAAVAAYAAALQVTPTEGSRRGIEDNIDTQILKIQVPDLNRLVPQVTEPTTRSKISTRIVQLTASPSAPVAESSFKELPMGASSSGERSNVGIVLPLSGKFAAYGRKALDGILVASRVFSERDIGLRLYVEDSESNPALAEAAVEKLVRNNAVIAVIGPLNLKEAVAAADKAQELGVLNLSLSAKEGIAERGAYLFQNAMTPRVQLESLAEYSVKDRNLKRFAIIAPNNAFGKDMANAFWDAVEFHGGRVVAHETYSPDEKDFQSTIANLVGVANAKYRGLEWKKLNDWAKEEKAKGRKEPKLKLEPLIDFDSVFIPDGPKQAGSIAASLAYYDVNAPLLGTTEWNSELLYRRGGKYVEGAIFPGGITTSTKSPSQREFIKQYIESYGNSPDLLATQSYEALYLVASAIAKSGSPNRNDMVREMSQLKNLEGPLGLVGFTNTRVAQRKVPIYTLESGGNIIEQ